MLTQTESPHLYLPHVNHLSFKEDKTIWPWDTYKGSHSLESLCLKFSEARLTALAGKVNSENCSFKKLKPHAFTASHPGLSGLVPDKWKKTFLKSSECIRLFSWLFLRGVPTCEAVLYPAEVMIFQIDESTEFPQWSAHFCTVPGKRQTLHCPAELILVLKATFADHFQ